MTSFNDKCKQIWPDNTAARLGRFSKLGHRTAQKMLAQQIEVPEDLRSGVDVQIVILMGADPSVPLQSVVDKAIASGLSKEAVASRLSVIYRELLGLDIS